MTKTFSDKKSGRFFYGIPQIYDAKFLIVAAEGGRVVEINHFGSFKDAKQVFDEIASDHDCEPETVNKSGYYDVSIWEWTEDRYEKVQRDDSKSHY